VGNAFSHCNGSSVFSSREAVSSVNMTIFNKLPPMGFAMCVWEQSHIYMSVSQLFPQDIALPPNVISIKCHDFERPMISRRYFVSLNNVQSL
jgi:hypothetical protein